MKEEKEITQEGKDASTYYEAGFHILPSFTESEAGELAESIEKGITKAGGVLVSKEAPKKMALAYEMGRKEAGKNKWFSESYFGWIKFEGDGEVALKVDELLKENEAILRYLVIKTVKEDTFFHKDEEKEVADIDEEGDNKKTDGADEDTDTTEKDEARDTVAA